MVRPPAARRLDVGHPPQRHQRAQQVCLGQDEEGQEEVVLYKVEPARQGVRVVGLCRVPCRPRWVRLIRCQSAPVPTFRFHLHTIRTDPTPPTPTPAPPSPPPPRTS